MMNNAMKLEFDALSENEALARMVMAAFTAPLNPTVRQLTEIKTAVSEAVTNCIVHGYAGKSGKVRLSAYINDGVLTVTVSDDGAGIGDISRAMEPFFTTQPEGGYRYHHEKAVEGSGLMAEDYGAGNSTKLIVLAQQGDMDARERLIVLNTPLVKAMARRFCCGHDREDIMQIGFVGLLKAINGFNPAFNVRFSTYAVPLIIGEIKRYLRDEGALRVTRSVKELAVKARQEEQRLCEALGRSPTLEELSEALSCSRENLVEALESTRTAISLEQPLRSDDEPLMDRISAPEGPDRTDIISLRDGIKALPAEDKQIIIMRYFLNYTQTKIAESMGWSQVQVSRAESRILKSLGRVLNG